MSKLLKSAIANLAIANIALRASTTEFSDGYNHLNIRDIPKKTQSFRSVIKIEAIEMVSPGQEDQIKIFYCFHYRVGSRVVTAINEGDASQDGTDEHEVVLTVEACFEALYQANKELTKDELEAFAARNVGYNVWPYWREYLQGTCSRMSITPIKVPFYKFKEESDLPERDE
jgi:hypothetical protein